MSRDWKPGDVAMVGGEAYLRTGEGWLFASRSGSWSHAERSSALRVTSLARPLVAIDPEDRNQVERLEALYLREEHNECDNTSDCMADALREFANPTPPKPEEPLGLGAVVEDADGETWVRVRAGSSNYRQSSGLNAGRYRAYDDIKAVRVLSEGVTP